MKYGLPALVNQTDNKAKETLNISISLNTKYGGIKWKDLFRI